MGLYRWSGRIVERNSDREQYAELDETRNRVIVVDVTQGPMMHTIRWPRRYGAPPAGWHEVSEDTFTDEAILAPNGGG